MSLNSSEQPTVATSIPTQPGSPGSTPPPTPAGTSWYRKRWVLPVAAGLVGLTIGAAGSGGNDELLAAAEAKADRSAADVADLETRLASARDAAAQAQTDAAKAKTDAEAALKADRAKLEADQKAHADKVAADNSALDAREAKVGGLEAEAKANEFGGDGIYLVGSDIKPGTYKADPASSGNCYYARLTGPGGEIIDNNNTSGPVVVTIKASDGALEVSGCETFRKVG